MGKEVTSGIVLTSFRPGLPDLPPETPTELDELVADESVAWQHVSSYAADAVHIMMPSIIQRTHALNGVTYDIPQAPKRVPPDPNRVLEVHGLMGAIGEQTGLALTADLDARRLLAESREATDDELVYRLRIRAMSEMSAYFTLGAAHSLANLTLRILLLFPDVSRRLDPTGRKYPPGNEQRESWGTLSSISGKIRNVLPGAKPEPLRRLASAVVDLQTTTAFTALEERRGMDFHRRRPQSVEHTALSAGIYRREGSFATLEMPAPSRQPESDAVMVHAMAQAGLHAVVQTMQLVRTNLGPSLREEGFTYSW